MVLLIQSISNSIGVIERNNKMSDSMLGKKAEKKVKEWLQRPEEGFCFYRLPDQMTGFYGSTNPCDFILYRKPYMYFLESKATESDRFDFSMLTQNQHDEMLKFSKIEGVRSYVVVLFATYQRAFIFDIQHIVAEMGLGTKSVNIKKISKWTIPFREIKTIPSRKVLLDYDFEDAKEIFN